MVRGSEPGWHTARMDADTVRASWLSDPSGRHQHRYWDGTAWTAHVADAGHQGVDPPSTVLAAPAAAPAAWLPDPTARHEYRYWDGAGWTEHVADDGRESLDPPLGALAPAIAGAPPTSPLTAPPPAYAHAPVGGRTTSGFAIASMVLGILWVWWIGSILALVFGYLALGRIKASAGYIKGRGMAIAGVVLGWIGVGVLIITIVVLVTTPHALDRHRGPNGEYCSNYDDSIFPHC
jgi:hypothetical protein